jgi:uncharacterized OB-fold protein
MISTIVMSGNRAYPPRVTEFTSYFWDNLANGTFTTTFCETCGKFTFPPKSFCPHCWSKQMSWRELSGRGKLYAMTTVHAAPAAFVSEAPYRVGIVDLDENLRIATRIFSDSEIPLDSEVEIVLVKYLDGPLFGAKATKR